MRKATVRIQSFSRLFPAMVYPGCSETDPEAVSSGHREPHASYQIDALNPLTWQRAIYEARTYAPDCVLIPWWTVFVSPCIWFLCNRLRKAGIPIIMLCHNVQDHERSVWKRFLTSYVLRNAADSYLVQSHSVVTELQALLPDVRVRLHLHPIYDHYPTPSRTMQRRSKIELLFFGFIRRYKGLPVLIEALSLIHDLDVHLSVVGEFWTGENVARQHAQHLGVANRIEFIPRYVNEVEAAAYFTRADAVVLPYLGATGSGVIPLAYHYNKPVIASNTGGLMDYVIDDQTGVLVTPGDARSLADGIRKLAARDPHSWLNPIEQFKRGVSWDSMADAILDEARSLQSRPIVT
jgi:glycosyltransferase involved in cell wall biosynthesis